MNVYESALQPGGVFGAVLERSDDTAFFYLLDLRMEQGRQIVAAFNAHVAIQTAPAIEANIEWAPAGDIVGLFFKDALVAVFDLSGGITARAPVPRDVLRFSDTNTDVRLPTTLRNLWTSVPWRHGRQVHDPARQDGG